MWSYLFTFGYILLNGLSVVIIHYVGNTIPVDLMIALSSFYALIFFHALNIKNLLPLYQKVAQHIYLYLVTIFIFLIMWLACFIIPIYYTPAILMFYATAWPSFFGAYKKYRKTKDRMSMMIAIAILLIILSFYIALYQVYAKNAYLLLVLGTLIAGITMFVYSQLSFKMNLAGFKPSEILAVRFILLFILPLLWTFKTKTIYLINIEVLWMTLLVSFSSLIAPIYCSQISILKVGPDNHSIAMGLTPFVAFLFEFFYLKAQNSIPLDGYFSALLLFAIMSYQLNILRLKK